MSSDDFFAQMDDGDDILALQKCNANKFTLDGGDDDDRFIIDFTFTGFGQPNDDLKAIASAVNFEHVEVV